MISTEGFQRDLAKYYSREKRDLPWQLANGPKTAAELKNSIADKRLPGILQVLEREGLMRRKTKTYHLG